MKRHHIPWIILGAATTLGLIAATWWGLSQKRSPSYQVSGWLPPYAGAAGQQSLLDNLDAVDEINFFWYVMTAEGTIVDQSSAEHRALLPTIRQAGLRVVPTVINEFDPDRVHAVLHDEAKRTAHIQALVELVQENAYDGIEIDYEGLHATSRDDFSAFIEELARALHREKKRVAIAVHPKTAPGGSWDGPRAQDWTRIGAAVDEFKIMTYDYHWSTSEAGPIAPPHWIDQVLTFAEQVVLADKIWMGIPFYGYVWKEKDGLGLTWREMEQRAKLFRAQPTRDPDSQEMTFTYVTAQQETYTAYYQDAASIAAKLDVLLNKHPDIAGICIWRLGDQDPAVWEVIGTRLKPGK